MNQDLKKLLKRWWKARIKAEGNTKLLIRNYALFSSLCSSRMRRLSKAEADLDALESQIGTFPAQLVYWWKTRRDAGCSHCWVTSNPSKMHAECDQKIKRWFAARQALEDYVAEL